MDEKDAEIARLRAQLAQQQATTAAPAQPVTPTARSDKGAGGWLIGILVLAAAFFGFQAWVQSAGDSYNAEDPNLRIAQSCEREYGDRGEQAVMACKIQLSGEYVAEAEAKTLDRARDGAR